MKLVFDDPINPITMTAATMQQPSEQQQQILSQREVQVLALIAAGYGNMAAAAMLHISGQTVKNHLSSILRKLQVTDRTAACVVALRDGLIDYPKPEQLQEAWTQGKRSFTN